MAERLRVGRREQGVSPGSRARPSAAANGGEELAGLESGDGGGERARPWGAAGRATTRGSQAVVGSPCHWAWLLRLGSKAWERWKVEGWAGVRGLGWKGWELLW